LDKKNKINKYVHVQNEYNSIKYSLKMNKKKSNKSLKVCPDKKRCIMFTALVGKYFSTYLNRQRSL